jgi:hypothetical protein
MNIASTSKIVEATFLLSKRKFDAKKFLWYNKCISKKSNNFKE